MTTCHRCHVNPTRQSTYLLCEPCKAELAATQAAFDAALAAGDWRGALILSTQFQASAAARAAARRLGMEGP